MTKGYARFLSGLFLLFLGGFLAAHLLTADRDFSASERRYLAQLPAFSLEAAASGAYMDELEEYVNDQFPLREGWVALKSWCQRLSGQRENNGIYFGSEDTLIPRFETPSQERLAQNLDFVRAFRESCGIPVKLALIPTSARIWADRLPYGAPTADQGALLSQIKEDWGEEDSWVDLDAVLTEHSGEAVYYRTDHHWTSLGAGYAASALGEALGLGTVTPEDYDPVTVGDFYGTSAATAGVGWTAPDSILRYVPEEGFSVTSYITGSAEEGALYYPEALGGDDPYAYFLGGNQPLCVIRNGDGTGERVLLVRDSYADSLTPFLAELCGELHLIDLRYYKGSIRDYAAENDIDQVVLLYALDNFVEDTNLYVLGK